MAYINIPNSKIVTETSVAKITSLDRPPLYDIQPLTSISTQKNKGQCFGTALWDISGGDHRLETSTKVRS
jgi:hypothetical protein